MLCLLQQKRHAQPTHARRGRAMSQRGILLGARNAAVLGRLTFIVSLLCSLTIRPSRAAKIYSAPAYPRGWQAARVASEELLAKLELKRSRLSARAATLLQDRSAAQQETPRGPAAESVPQKTQQQPAAREAVSASYTAGQLALPALALSLISGLLGWLLRSWEGRHEAASTAAEADVPAPLREGDTQAAARATRRESTHAVQASGNRLALEQQGRTGGCSAQAGRGSKEAEHPPLAADAGSSSKGTRNCALESGVSQAVHYGLAERAPDRGEQHGAAATNSPQNDSDKQSQPCQQADGSEGAVPEASSTDAAPASSRPREAAHAQPKAGQSPGWLRQANSGRASGITDDPGTSGRERTAADDIAVVMEALAEQLRLDVDAMVPHERMQLLQMALQCCQHRDNIWLHAQANDIRYSHAAAAHGSLQHQKDQAAAADARQRLEAFRRTIEDGLLAGLALMLAALLVCGVRCGYLGTRIGRCRSPSSLPTITFLRPWAALDALVLLGCYARATSDALLACCIMLGTAFAVVRGGILRGSPHHAPQLKLALGLGGVCGLAGFLAVGRLGGDARRWLLLWEAWVGLHVAASWQMRAVHGTLGRGRWAAVRAGAYQAGASLVLPLAMAVVPFDGCSGRIWRTVAATLGR